MNSGCATTIRNGYNQTEKFGAIADIWAKRLAAVIDAIDPTRTLAAAFGAMYGPLTCYTNPRSLALGKPEQRNDIQNENPFPDYVIAPFCRSVSGSGVHLSGIRKNAGSLEARFRIWNIPVYLCRGAARRRGSLSGEDSFPAMPRQLNGFSSERSRRMSQPILLTLRGQWFRSS